MNSVVFLIFGSLAEEFKLYLKAAQSLYCVYSLLNFCGSITVKLAIRFSEFQKQNF